MIAFLIALAIVVFVFSGVILINAHQTRQCERFWRERGG